MDGLPPYRKVGGTPKAFNQYRGWENIRFGSAKMAEAYSLRPILDSINALEDLTGNAKPGSHPVMGYPPEVEIGILKELGYGWSDPGIHLSHSSLTSIIDRARTTVLDWALGLEKAGVKGENLSFSADEQIKAKAPSASTVYNATHMTVVQTMNHSQIQQDSPGARQVYTVSTIDPAKLLELVNAIRKELPGLALKEDDRDQLASDLATLEAQANAPKPSVGIVSEVVTSVRKILESAAGSMTASNLPTLIQQAAALFM